MLPAELMGLNSKKFKQFNYLVKNKKFINALVSNVGLTLQLIKNKKYNSIIINYDEKSESLFKWYQQLLSRVWERKKGLLLLYPICQKIITVLCNFILMDLKITFFFFYVHDQKSEKINNNRILESKYFLKNKNISNIIYAQKKATENIFQKKKIPFRSFEIKKRNEKTLGELFCFFILETILLGKCLKLNPYNQPAVELIKNETTKLLI